jgi:hypothetical protein
MKKNSLIHFAQAKDTAELKDLDICTAIRHQCTKQTKAVVTAL